MKKKKREKKYFLYLEYGTGHREESSHTAYPAERHRRLQFDHGLHGYTQTNTHLK